MLNSIISSEITITSFLICMGVSLALGVATAALSLWKSKSSQSFALTIAVLPAAVAVVIMLVNGNIGAGVAVAGAFSLVRFRSAPGSAQEILFIFMAMAIGLAAGMGYVVLAAIFFAIVALFIAILNAVNFGGTGSAMRELKITIPESLDYDGLFDDIFAKYTDGASLETVKTTNMGTMFELKYAVRLKEATVPKAFLDEVRCRNGNLTVTCGKPANKEAL